MNAALNTRQFWDGRVATLEEQVSGPVTNPSEMHSSWPLIVNRLQSDPSYSGAFQSAFGAAATKENIIDAIASYERTLLTPNSVFDQFIEGDKNALNARQHRGFVAFNDLGCTACHQGVNLGGNLYQKIGLVHDFYQGDAAKDVSNQGLYNITKNESDRFVFRVPTLRNVAQTAPYFHDGSSSNLDDAVTKMAFYQLGIALDKQTISDIVAFLGALSSAPLSVEDRDEHFDEHDHETGGNNSAHEADTHDVDMHESDAHEEHDHTSFDGADLNTNALTDARPETQDTRLVIVANAKGASH